MQPETNQFCLKCNAKPGEARSLLPQIQGGWVGKKKVSESRVFGSSDGRSTPLAVITCIRLVRACKSSGSGNNEHLVLAVRILVSNPARQDAFLACFLSCRLSLQSVNLCRPCLFFQLSLRQEWDGVPRSLQIKTLKLILLWSDELVQVFIYKRLH